MVSFDVADPGVVGAYREDFLQLIEHSADIVFANRDEASVLYESTPEQAAQNIAANGAILSSESNVINDIGTAGHEEFMAEFANNAIKSPFQDGHYIYTVIAGGGSGSASFAPILYIADLESPASFHKKLQP
mgnify:CR=1 FL=1